MNIKLLILFFVSFLIFGCSSSEKGTNSSSSKKKNSLSEKERINFDYLFFNANKERILGNYELAANLFAKCIQINPKEPTPYYELANIYDYAKEPLLALKYAKKAVELDPENYWFRVVYANSLQKTGDIESAINQYNILIKKTPGKIDLYYELAQLQLYSKKYLEAIKTYNQLEKIIGISEEISLQKEKIYVQLGDIENAAAEVTKLIEKYPNESKFLGTLADLYLANDMDDKAYEIFQDILKKEPNNPLAQLSLYDYYKKKGEDKKAFEKLKIAFKNNHVAIDAKVQILLSYFSTTELKPELKPEATELNKLLIETHPSNAKSYTIYGDFLYRDKNLKEAQKNYSKAAKLDDSKFPIWNQLILIESELQDFESLYKDSKRAMALFPNQSMFYFFYGLANIKKKEYKEAAEYLNIGKDFVIDNDPLLAQFYTTLGDAYNKMEQHNDSDNAYEKALEIEPKNVYALNNYSYFLSLRADKLERAAELSALANKLEPNQPNYQDTYAWILYKQEKYKEAKEWLEKAIENGGGSNTVILEHLGDAYFKLSNPDKALEYWNKAKKAGKGSEFLEKKIADKKLYD